MLNAGDTGTQAVAGAQQSAAATALPLERKPLGYKQMMSSTRSGGARLPLASTSWVPLERENFL